MDNLVTFVNRVADCMILVATMDESPDLEKYKHRAKALLRTIKPDSPSRCTFEEKDYLYHYIMENGVVYLTIAEKGYPRTLAFQYLEKLQEEFQRWHGADVARYDRPYAAVDFDPTMNEIRRDFIDPQAPANLKKLNKDLHQIQHIMSQNIEEVLKRGEKVDQIHSRATRLLGDSEQYAKKARWLNIQAMYRQIIPLVILLIVIIFILYLRFR